MIFVLIPMMLGIAIVFAACYGLYLLCLLLYALLIAFVAKEMLR